MIDLSSLKEVGLGEMDVRKIYIMTGPDYIYELVVKEDNNLIFLAEVDYLRDGLIKGRTFPVTNKIDEWEDIFADGEAHLHELGSIENILGNALVEFLNVRMVK